VNIRKTRLDLVFFRMLAPYELDVYGIFVAYVYVYNKGLPRNFASCRCGGRGASQFLYMGPQSVKNYSFLWKSTACCAPGVWLRRNIFLRPGSVYGVLLKTVKSGRLDERRKFIWHVEHWINVSGLSLFFEWRSPMNSNCTGYTSDEFADIIRTSHETLRRIVVGSM